MLCPVLLNECQRFGYCRRRGFLAQKFKRRTNVEPCTNAQSKLFSPAFGNTLLVAGNFNLLCECRISLYYRLPLRLDLFGVQRRLLYSREPPISGIPLQVYVTLFDVWDIVGCCFCCSILSCSL